MEKYPKNLFCPAWAIMLQGKIVELLITEVSSDKIYAKQCTNQYYKFSYNEDKEKWENCSGVILVFDLQCDETQQLINNRLTKRTQNVESSYIEAVKKYRESKGEIESIRSNNAKIIERFKTAMKG